MKKLSRQTGSAHVIIVVLLSLGLMSALGYIFWQNFNRQPEVHTAITKPENDNEDKKNDEIMPAVADKTESIGEPFGTNFIFKYPESWGVKTTVTGPNPANDNDMTTVTSTVTSPSGKVEVVYSYGNGGLGGMCLKPESGTIAKLQYQGLESVKNTSFVEVVSLSKDGKYYGYSGLMKNDTKWIEPLSTLKAGDSTCAVYLREIIPIKVSGKASSAQLVNSYIKIEGQWSRTDDGRDIPVMKDTTEEVTKPRSSEEYEAAKQILLSTKFEYDSTKP